MDDPGDMSKEQWSKVAIVMGWIGLLCLGIGLYATYQAA